MPKNTTLNILQATRPATLPLILAPFLVGTAAGIPNSQWQWGWLGLSLMGVITLHLAANVTNEWFDYLSGADSLTP